jgi:hypothetical protein
MKEEIHILGPLFAKGIKGQRDELGETKIKDETPLRNSPGTFLCTSCGEKQLETF